MFLKKWMLSGLLVLAEGADAVRGAVRARRRRSARTRASGSRGRHGRPSASRRVLARLASYSVVTGCCMHDDVAAREVDRSAPTPP